MSNTVLTAFETEKILASKNTRLCFLWVE